MPYTEWIADYLRKALESQADVKEKKMFGSLAFLVRGKMCLNAGPERLMCRVDPQLHEELILKDGVTEVLMRNKVYPGFLYISSDVLKDSANFDCYIGLALQFNKEVAGR